MNRNQLKKIIGEELEVLKNATKKNSVDEGMLGDAAKQLIPVIKDAVLGELEGKIQLLVQKAMDGMAAKLAPKPGVEPAVGTTMTEVGLD
jgi:hypothetical protein